MFLGTSEFAVPALRALAAAGERVSLVVTQPDRPTGRGRRLVPTPVKGAAEELGLAVFQPASVNAPESVERLKASSPEFLVVVAYGQLLKPDVLALARRAPVNLHASLLPLHRGPSPVAWTVLEGDRQAGNTTMVLEEGLDSGPVLLQDAFALDPRFTRGDLERELSHRGAALLVETLQRLRQGTVTPVPQDHARATWSRLLTRALRTVDWEADAAVVSRTVHALSPSPAVLVRARGRLVKLLRVERVEAPSGSEPGCVAALRREGPVVACATGGVLLAEVQPEGKRPMTGGDFVRGGGLAVGDTLGPPDDV